MLDLSVTAKNIFIDGRLTACSVGVKDGIIVSIGTESPEAVKVVDAGDRIVLPGMADSHVHIREPGNPHRETFATGTAAAINGGVTTVCEHPLSSPPPYSLDILRKRFEATHNELFSDIAFMGAAGEYNLEDIASFAESGEIIAFKTFLHEPIKGREFEFYGLTMCTDGVIVEGIKALARTSLPWLVHAENNAIIQHNIARFRAEEKVSPVWHTRSRPPVSEYETVSKLLLLTEEHNLPVFFCHISTPEACEIIKAAKAKGRTVYLETCPHYLLFTEESLEHLGSFAKCSPPLRTAERRDALWQYITDGTIDVIGSDHAPYTLNEKDNPDIFIASAGFPAIEARVPIMFTKVMQGKLSLEKMVALLSTNIAKIFNLYPRKGIIALGADADFVVIDQDEHYKLAIKDMYCLSKESAKLFDGLEMIGKIVTVILRGTVVKENGKVLLEHKGHGQILKPLTRSRVCGF